MRWWGAILIGIALVQCSGCVVVVASVASAAAITATTIKTTGKVTTATVSTTGRVAAAALNSSGDVAVLTLESAAKLARAGKVVLVDAGTGAVVELPWENGLQAMATSRAGGLEGAYRAARIFRTGQIIRANLKQIRGGTPAVLLQPGDVVELQR